jgi:glycerophosphoryl diester phosphodiesterase
VIDGREAETVEELLRAGVGEVGEDAAEVGEVEALGDLVAAQIGALDVPRGVMEGIEARAGLGDERRGDIAREHLVDAGREQRGPLATPAAEIDGAPVARAIEASQRTLDRTTDARGPVLQYTLADLRRVDAAYNFTLDGGRTFPHRGAGVVVPTLESLLALDPRVRVNLEIKSPDPTTVRAVWAFIDHHRVHDRVLVASEHSHVVERFRALSRGRVATSAGTREVFSFWLAARLRLPHPRPAYDAFQVPVTQGPLTVINPRFLEAAHRHRLHVHAWTIDDPAELRRLIDLGVDGIVTDRPDRLLPLLAAPSARPTS